MYGFYTYLMVLHRFSATSSNLFTTGFLSNKKKVFHKNEIYIYTKFYERSANKDYAVSSYIIKEWGNREITSKANFKITSDKFQTFCFVK